MPSPRFEALLSSIYTDDESRQRFILDPRSEALRAGLSEHEATALENIDLIGLEFSARSLARKREKKANSKKSWRWFK